MEFEWLNSKIAEASIEVILVFDEKGNVLYGNKTAADKLGYSKEELLECNMVQVFKQEFQSEDKEGTPFKKEKILEKKEMALYRKNSSCFFANVRSFCMENGICYLMAEDITGQKDIDTRIRQMKETQENDNRARTEFIANVTHELRTPVNGIKGHITTLMDSVENEEQRKIMDVILYCCENMSSIINNILDFSKLDANKLVLEEDEFDFYKMMDNVITTHTATVNKKDLKLNVFVDEKIPRLLIGDELRLNRILNNLISNAVKFTSVGSISISVNKVMQMNDEIELFFMVKDTGIGISKEEQNRLFQSFSQVDASITRRFGGTGLGLAITKQLVEMMNGSIHVESEKGKGSAFTFSVKLRMDENVDEVQEQSKVYNKWSQFTSAMITEEENQFYQFGTDENREEIRKRMEKLMLSIELGAWDKAETLTETLKTLMEGGGSDLKRLLLRLGMAVRKANYEKSMEVYKQMKGVLFEKFDEE
uniref:ATP-binding protein n=1 Tax=Agathobacter sp. TaxID=2021311 RepID=UPI004056EBA3